MTTNKSKVGCGTYIQLSKRFPGVPLKILSECGTETFGGGYILCDKCTLSKSKAKRWIDNSKGIQELESNSEDGE